MHRERHGIILALYKLFVEKVMIKLYLDLGSTFYEGNWA